MIRRLHKRGRYHQEVEFDQILTDASNVSALDQARLEGRLELPITKRGVYYVGFIATFIMVCFAYSIFSLQIIEGAEKRYISDNNILNQGLVIAERGVVYDRNGELLVWNEFDQTDRHEFAARAYTDKIGLGQVLGYVSYPQKDSHGFYWRTEYEGRTGVESTYNNVLSGRNGQKIVEANALGEIIAEHVIAQPQPGAPLTLSLDAELTQAMYDIIATSSAQAGFRSGAGAIMDIETGELIAMTSYPSYDPQVMADGQQVDLINSWNTDERFPFLNKMVGGVYTPGSVVKPFVAYGALVEGVVRPERIIVSTGEIVVPNPYNPSLPSRFTDWRAHGAMNLREAIAFSSNVYMYYISGGFADQVGIGITKMANYFNQFGLGELTGSSFSNEQSGVVPTPSWKQEVFDDDWRLGDTYLTSIGQFGFQSTPLQMLRAYALLASGDTMVVPHVILGERKASSVPLDQSALQVVREGMRMAVNYDGGTARPLQRSDVAIAAKSGTAEIGFGNAYVNSWVAGYFPYEDPQYAFVIMMDKAPRTNQLGATRVMGDVVSWMADNRPVYLGLPAIDELE